MGELRALERGTRIIAVGQPLRQEDILIVDDIRTGGEAWKGDQYLCFPAHGGFGRLITATEMFDAFRQVHPSELDRVPWERRKFSLEDPDADIPTMHSGLYRFTRGSGGWAEPWFTHEALLKIRDLWHKEYVGLIASHGRDTAEDLYYFLFDERFGWMHWSGANDSMEFLESAIATIDGEQVKVWNAQCGLTWTEWTDEEIETLRANLKEDS
jgi:hypothetical protein